MPSYMGNYRAAIPGPGACPQLTENVPHGCGPLRPAWGGLSSAMYLAHHGGCSQGPRKVFGPPRGRGRALGGRTLATGPLCLRTGPGLLVTPAPGHRAPGSATSPRSGDLGHLLALGPGPFLTLSVPRRVLCEAGWSGAEVSRDVCREPTPRPLAAAPRSRGARRHGARQKAASPGPGVPHVPSNGGGDY